MLLHLQLTFLPYIETTLINLAEACNLRSALDIKRTLPVQQSIHRFDSECQRGSQNCIIVRIKCDLGSIDFLFE